MAKTLPELQVIRASYDEQAGPYRAWSAKAADQAEEFFTEMKRQIGRDTAKAAKGA